VGVNRPVTITIDVLSVEGFEAGQARRMGSAFESELGELIRSEGLPRCWNAPGEAASLTLESTAVSARHPEQAGKVLARMLYGRLAG
jgi:hypothetical protein